MQGVPIPQFAQFFSKPYEIQEIVGPKVRQAPENVLCRYQANLRLRKQGVYILLEFTILHVQEFSKAV